MSKNDNTITNIYTLSGGDNTIISTIEYFDGRIYMIFGKDIISMVSLVHIKLEAL